MIKVALPNKGVLFEPTAELLASCGYKVSKTLRSLNTIDAENQVEFYFLRPGDIPTFVAKGILDAGITGKDFVAEKGLEGAPCPCLLDLHYGHSKLCVAVPEGNGAIRGLEDLATGTIATSFPNITRARCPAGVRPRIEELEGAVEISIKLGIADAIVDLVETGTTLKQAGLKVVGEPLFRSNAALFAHPGQESLGEVQILKNRIEGKLVAYAYMMVEYDAPEAILERACAVTPGIESPTVTALRKPGWFSVKSMILKREANRILDELSRIGCKGILLTSIESARI